MTSRNNNQGTPGFRCRFCGAALRTTFVDLGMSPLCQTHIAPDQLHQMEPFYPLHAYVCDDCFLVQLQEFVSPGEIFTEYAYFSSYSTSWVEHARRYAEMASSASDSGRAARSWRSPATTATCCSISSPAACRCSASSRRPTWRRRRSRRASRRRCGSSGAKRARAIAREHGRPDLLLGNNVLAHVPDLNDFVAGMKVLLAPDGVITMEFPHLQRLMAENQFDTIYHEHFSYFSFVAVERVFAHHGLTLFDVEELPTHGGSLRIYARHAENARAARRGTGRRRCGSARSTTAS